MTSSSQPGWFISPFAPATSGWRIAIGDPENRDVTVVPVVGWQPVPEGAKCSIEGSFLEPVVLFDNVKEPTITTVLETIAGWSKGTYVHQVLAPGAEVRGVPDDWTLVDPYEG
ncbi:hypothetical protein [Streptomyces cupreus]|uniref:Uncharacterized protein n=1 Tax=Streptomyces cupreus TaxID=2759956 RepID=A0A7X1J8N7_9ACTN|nr:hypothetical protein [Streptomyces cupreus]MBC2906209.1 hypothetical protein [Streptomyces cupreus]